MSLLINSVFSRSSRPIHLSILISLLTLLAGCSSNKTVEGWLAPDPQLKAKIENSNPSPTNSPNPTPTLTPTQAQLPENFPEDIPLYPQATLIATESLATKGTVKTTWRSSDTTETIEKYYQERLSSLNWEITAPLAANPSNGERTLVARRNDLEVTVAISPASVETKFAIEYQPSQNLTQQTPSPSPTAATTLSPLNFTDLQALPEQSRKYVEDLANLGIVTAASGDDLFQGDRIITRREYARWLFNANNRIYADNPGKQIRLASDTSQAAFSDVPKNDPDFAIVQGLAEAGLIPSPLTDDSTEVLFRPDAPLTRETLILWKVPLDTRKALPNASIDSVKQTWGFQDAAKINAKALRSLFADFQNGEKANIRRVFGYTTLFQPQKPVTRLEAATALWYFGDSGEGRSAADALQISDRQQ